MRGEQGAVVAQLTALVGDLQRRPPGISGGMSEIVDSAARHVPGAQYAAITEVRENSKIATIAPTGREPVLLDEIQQRHWEGPCVSAAWEHHTVRVDDLDADTRWPNFRRDALAETSVRSIMAFELFVGKVVTGALNFYADSPRAFDEDSLELGMIFATHTALAWSVLRRDEEFRSALASRDLIGQAKGMIMERYRIDAVGAFELLKRLSQESNTKLVEVAQRVVAAE
ncbi:GAF and ANTAR domain-containing protein [Mycobacterium sp. E740]|uniref:GAF and ANTAR domain-containing protein n=1 Tax=Mycobacterium sp. E740 TaxID=1834149 RepID=UPI0007FE0D0F|nr:GAF and ANTAR domain-containing protein [Mycobacterium sp. E740]OBI79383.1 response regulator receiver protein [Mycobacterium sp. E740]